MRNKAEHALSLAETFYPHCDCDRHAKYRRHQKDLAHRARRRAGAVDAKLAEMEYQDEVQESSLCECMGGLAGPCPYGDEDGSP